MLSLCELKLGFQRSTWALQQIKKMCGAVFIRFLPPRNRYFSYFFWGEGGEFVLFVGTLDTQIVLAKFYVCNGHNSVLDHFIYLAFVGVRDNHFQWNVSGCIFTIFGVDNLCSTFWSKFQLACRIFTFQTLILTFHDNFQILMFIKKLHLHIHLRPLTLCCEEFVVVELSVVLWFICQEIVSYYFN